MLFCEGICDFFVKIILFLVLTLVFHYVYLLWNRNYWINRGVFSPNPGNLLGNLPGQVNGKRHIMYELDDFYQKYKSSRSCVGIFNFRTPRLLVFDPSVVRDIFITHFKNFQGTEFYGKTDAKTDPLFGEHMFLLAGEEWKKKRQEVSPAFTATRIKAIHPILVNVYDKMQKYVKDESAKKDCKGFDIKDLISRYTISVVSNSIYNVDPKTFEGGESEILNRAQVFLAPSNRFIIHQVITSLYPFVGNFYKVSLSQPGSAKFFIDLMDNSMKQREASGVKNLDYLDHLMTLKKKKEISDLSISQHGASFLVDGYDTSSGTVAAVLYECAKNKEIQNKLRNEINTEMPSDDDFTYDNIMNLEYLDQVWYEALRLRNPLTHVARMCTEDITLDMPKDKKVSLVKGDVVYIPARSMWKDPDYFENPLKFDPERFSPENGGVKQYLDSGIFFPFGEGPRNCPGNRFAAAQGKFCVASLIKDFEVSVNSRTIEHAEIHPQAIVENLTDCYLDFKPI